MNKSARKSAAVRQAIEKKPQQKQRGRRGGAFAVLKAWDARLPAQELHLQKEKTRARELRSSRWWQQLVAQGRCHHCGGKFLPEQLTMEHLLPLALGGRSDKGNVVPACKPCNNQKKNQLPWHWQPSAAEDADDS